MKYIRTKDGICTNEQYKNALEICALTYENAQNSDLKIIKQADTIEELCDEFVIDSFGEKDVWNELSVGLIQKHLGRKHIIYGAIWTNKGLIYVAKMNEEGELELWD